MKNKTSGNIPVTTKSRTRTKVIHINRQLHNRFRAFVANKNLHADEDGETNINIEAEQAIINHIKNSGIKI